MFNLYLFQPPDISSLDRPLNEYECDTALTVMGNVLAQMVGRAMYVGGRPPDTVYCSPALRCIQTAAAAASMSGKSIKLRIEPGLFENFDLYPTVKPKFVTIQQLKKAGFDVDEAYEPFYRVEDVSYSLLIAVELDLVFFMDSGEAPSLRFS